MHVDPTDVNYVSNLVCVLFYTVYIVTLQVTEVLCRAPLTKLSPRVKTSTMVLLINELLSSQALCK